MSSDFERANQIENPLCIKCGKPCSNQKTFGRTNAWIHDKCTKPQVIFPSEPEEGEEA